jgi:hypothetical protein
MHDEHTLSRPPEKHPLALGIVGLGFLVLVITGWLRRKEESPEPFGDVRSDALAVGHETSDMRLRVVLACGAILIGASVLVVIGASAIDIARLGPIPRLGPGIGALDDVATPPVQGQPVLEARRGQELSALRAEEERVLRSYGWVDQPASVVRIPIDRAMDLIASRGLPARSASAAASFQDDATLAPSAASSGQVGQPADRW